MRELWFILVEDQPPIVIALAMGILAYLLSRVGAWATQTLALLVSGLVFIWGLHFFNEGHAPMTYENMTDLYLYGVNLNIHFSVTLLGNLVSTVAAALTAIVAVYSFGAMSGNYRESKFYAYLTLALVGTCIVTWSGNFLVLLIGWELVTLMLILMLNEGKSGSKTGAARTYAILGFADACLLLAIVLMLTLPTSRGMQLHKLAFLANTRPVEVGQLGATGYVVYALLLVAALARAGAIPLHTWIPAAARGATASALALLPGVLTKLLGIFLLARVSLYVFRPDQTMQIVLMVVGGLTIVIAGFRALAQHNLKRLLVFDDISQVGYILVGIGTGTAVGIIGGLFHMINSAVYGSNLFLMSGNVGRASGTYNIEKMGGLARRLPITFICGAISAAAISGVPPFNGFVSKWLVYQGALSLHSGLGVALLIAAVFGSALTLASFVKVLYSAFLSRPPVDSPAADTSSAKEDLAAALPMIILAAACIILGLFPKLITNDILKQAIPKHPEHLYNVSESVTSTGGTFGSITTGGEGLWSPSVAMALILIGIVFGGGLLVLDKIIRRRLRVVRPFLSGETGAGDDRFRILGTGFYETVFRLPLLKRLLMRRADADGDGKTDREKT